LIIYTLWPKKYPAGSDIKSCRVSLFINTKDHSNSVGNEKDVLRNKIILI
jgi:hypothetical protein